MKERPILFNGAMVRAILDGSKTQTRRIAKVHGELPPEWATFAAEGHSPTYTSASHPTGLFYWSEEQPNDGPLKTLRRWPIHQQPHPLAGENFWTSCPFADRGDRLWVRETWSSDFAHHYPFERVWYAADDARRYEIEVRDGVRGIYSPEGSVHVPFRWRPSIHMPRAAARITLEVTGVRVERLQAISEGDAEAEGIDFLRHVPDADETLTARQLFMCLWDSLATPGSDWAANPWVWVIEFRRSGA